ncbi:fatty acid desaturase family protein [Saccharopolyspora sp. NPDC000995]
MQPAETVVRARSNYSELLRRVKEAGLLNRRPVYYVVRIAMIALLFVGGWVAFVLLGRSWWQLAVAAALAMVFAQAGFPGNDAGHRQVLRPRRANDVVGFLSGNLGIGLSFGWWADKHNRHHADPNHEDRDPDVNGSAIAFTETDGRARRGLAKGSPVTMHLCSSRCCSSESTLLGSYGRALRHLRTVGQA